MVPLLPPVPAGAVELGHLSTKATELYAFTTEEAKRDAAKNALV